MRSARKSGRVAPGITPWRSRRSVHAQLRHTARPVAVSQTATLSDGVTGTDKRGSESSAWCPPPGPPRGASFPRQGPRSPGSPATRGTMRRSDFLRPSRRASLPSLGGTIPCACLRLSTQARRRPGARSFVVRQLPRRSLSRWSPQDLPGSQATRMHLRPVLRPRQDRTRLAQAACRHGPRADKTEGSPRL
jgi:hypothetical protein